MASTSTPPKASAQTAGQPFKVFCDEDIPQRSGSPATNVDFHDTNNENNSNAAISKPVSKSSAHFEPSRPAHRAPLTDITEEAVGRPRSLSAAMAEIAKLEDALEASKKQNQELKGDIVAYQDALHQADVDMCLWKD